MKGRLDGTSLRVPVPVGSITDFTAIVSSTSVDAVNAAFRAAAEGPLKGVLVYTTTTSSLRTSSAPRRRAPSTP